MFNRPSPDLIDSDRVRRIRGSFSQIEHRFINGRYIDLLDTTEILVYLFLIAVGDRRGISFYSSERMGDLLKLSVRFIEKAREGLVQKGFIAYRGGVYQVYEWLRERGVAVSYPSVVQYTKSFRKKKERVYHQLNFLPGEEGQVEKPEHGIIPAS